MSEFSGRVPSTLHLCFCIFSCALQKKKKSVSLLECVACCTAGTALCGASQCLLAEAACLNARLPQSVGSNGVFDFTPKLARLWCAATRRLRRAFEKHDAHSIQQQPLCGSAAHPL